MKKCLLACFLFAFLVACSSGPESAAQKFTENMAKGKYTEAKKYATESTGQLLDMVSGFGGGEVNPNFKFQLVDKAVDGNMAEVTYRDKNQPEGAEQTLQLVKIDGDWLVNMDMQK
ncbi:MAG: DUF4878 domain-containing protein [Tannerellaceae bacterium]|nr:DUF4878 domain-containing protein [Tannerellaceae bacterium]